MSMLRNQCKIRILQKLGRPPRTVSGIAFFIALIKLARWDVGNDDEPDSEPFSPSFDDAVENNINSKLQINWCGYKVKIIKPILG